MYKLITIATLLFFSINAFAQPQSGLKLSINSTYVENDEEYTFKPGVGFGLAYQQAFKLSNKFYCSVGIGYAHYKVTSTRTYIPEFVYINPVATETSDYLITPILLHYALKGISINSGYQYGYASPTAFTSSDYILNSNNHDHSALFGIAYNFKFISVSVEYTMSLNQMEKDEGILGYGIYGNGTGTGGDRTGQLEPIYGSPGSKKLNVWHLSLIVPLNKRKK